MKHQIIVRYSNRADRSLPLTMHLRKCIAAALEAEHVNVPCEINVLVTDDAGIRAINRAMRNIDRETDVLSFPMFQFTPGQFPEDVRRTSIRRPVCCRWAIWLSRSSVRGIRPSASAIRSAARRAI